MTGNGNLPTQADAGLPSKDELDALERMMREDAGAGISNRAADTLIPQITVLQPQSPETLAGKGRPGDFLAGDRVIPAADGVWFQPCGVRDLWIEFEPLDRGGGFVGTHPFTGYNQANNAIPPEGALTDPQNANRHRMPNGNNVIHYRQVAGFLWHDQTGLEFVMPFRSTGHTVWRTWQTEAGRLHRRGAKQAPLWSHVYHVTTEMVRNQFGQWYQQKLSFDDANVAFLGEPNALTMRVVGDPVAAYQQGKALHEAYGTDKEPAASVAADGRGD